MYADRTKTEGECLGTTVGFDKCHNKDTFLENRQKRALKRY
jgi:hypothetical protein